MRSRIRGDVYARLIQDRDRLFFPLDRCWILFSRSVHARHGVHNGKVGTTGQLVGKRRDL